MSTQVRSYYVNWSTWILQFLFVCVDALGPNQQFFNDFRTLSELNKYSAQGLSVLLNVTIQCLRWGSNKWPFNLKPSTLLPSLCTPQIDKFCSFNP